MDFKKKLKAIIKDIVTEDIDVNVINDDTVLTDDLGFDSVQIISLIVELESQFNIEIEDNDLDIEKITVFESLNNMLATKLNEN